MNTTKEQIMAQIKTLGDVAEDEEWGMVQGGCMVIRETALALEKEQRHVRSRERRIDDCRNAMLRILRKERMRAQLSGCVRRVG